MDGLPTELIKLCRLASMAECGDHYWASVPALGLWAAAWTPLLRRWRALVSRVLTDAPPGNLPAEM